MKPRIAVFTGPTATIANSPPLVTSDKARKKYGLPPGPKADRGPARYDTLRAQRLAAPVTVYVEQFSAHPLERDAAELYAPPDGYFDAAGTFHRERQGADDVPVYEVTLRPEDGLYLLPYMARQANEQPWEDDGTRFLAPPEECRQPFYPDASRLFEEIDRFGLGDHGNGSLLSALAEFDFYRAAPSGGYTRGETADRRTDIGDADIPPERLGADYFPYRPFWLRRSPQRGHLALVTNAVQRALDGGAYGGAIWMEGTPMVEESAYWMSLLIDTHLPLCFNAAQRAHGTLGDDGGRNLVDSVEYIVSGVWADEAGRDRMGAVMVQDSQIFAAREVQKADARPGGYTATGGHGGVIGRAGDEVFGTRPVVTFVPARRHTAGSAVNVRRLPEEVQGVQRVGGHLLHVPVRVKSAGALLPEAMPRVTILKDAQEFSADAAIDDGTRDPGDELELLARVERNLVAEPLAGFVGEGMAPYGFMSDSMDAALQRAVFSGMPVVKVGRGNNEGFTPPIPPFVSGNNLTAHKARLLLMACLLRFGSLPIAADPTGPTDVELGATMAAIARYQEVFDTH